MKTPKDWVGKFGVKKNIDSILGEIPYGLSRYHPKPGTSNNYETAFKLGRTASGNKPCVTIDPRGNNWHSTTKGVLESLELMVVPNEFPGALLCAFQDDTKKVGDYHLAAHGDRTTPFANRFYLVEYHVFYIQSKITGKPDYFDGHIVWEHVKTGQVYRSGWRY